MTADNWRAAMAEPCTCPPRPGDNECPRVEECYGFWAGWQAGARAVIIPKDDNVRAAR